jgi:hypothetical protein
VTIPLPPRPRQRKSFRGSIPRSSFRDAAPKDLGLTNVPTTLSSLTSTFWLRYGTVAGRRAAPALEMSCRPRSSKASRSSSSIRYRRTRLRFLALHQSMTSSRRAASDLARRPLPTDLIEFVHAMVSPPPRRVQRQAVVDLIAETPRSVRWRLEYPLLLKIVGSRRVGSQKSSTSVRKGAAKIVPPADKAAAVSSGPYSDPLKTLDYKRKITDQLAVHYGQLCRSSSVSQYLIVILGSWTSGVIGLVVPSLAVASITVQLAANALVIANAAFRERHRWQERWLDYRVTAERLRWLGLRYRTGLGAGRQTKTVALERKSWIAWYLQRTARALGPPQGRVDSDSIAAAANHLLEVEIPEQIDYHRGTFRQLRLLENRLFFAAHAALVASLCVAVLLDIATVRAGSLEAVGLKPLALVLLAVLPGTMTSLNGLRVEADLVRLAERSAQTLAVLFRVRRIILAAPRDYDHVACNIERLASIMRSELEEWRFVIESRRARAGRQFTKRRRLLRALTKLRKRLGSRSSRGDSLTA